METHNLRLYEIHSLSEMEKIQEAWKALILASKTATPFQTWEWNYGIAQYDAERVRLRIVVAENSNGEVVGIAPFCLRTKYFPGFEVLEFIGSHPSDYLDLIFLEPYRDIFVQHLLEWADRNSEWRIINLSNLSRDSSDMINKYGSFEIQPLGICFYTSLPASIKEYEKVMQKRLIQTVRQKLKLLSGEGRLEFSLSRTTSELRADLPLLFELHQRRQRAKGERGRFFNPQWRESFMEMSVSLFDSGFLRFGMMRIDGLIAACHYDLRIRDQDISYSLGMRPEMEEYRPGGLITHYMIGESIRDGARLYDFGNGCEPYKSRWAKESRQIFQVTRARSGIEALIWRKAESWRNKIYRSRLIKNLYHASVGRFQS